jgi:hypothetical protein
LTLLGVSFSTTDLAEVLDYQTRSWKACTIFEHTFKNKPDGASKSAIFRKPCPIFEHTFRVWCSIFDHQTQMTLHIERLLTVSVRNSNTSLENRVLFSNTFLESVIENRTPQGSVGRTCTIFEHRSGLGCAKFDHLCSIHANSPHVTQAIACGIPGLGSRPRVQHRQSRTVRTLSGTGDHLWWRPLFSSILC